MMMMIMMMIVVVAARGCPDLGSLPDVTVTEEYDGGVLHFECAAGMRRQGPQSLMCDGVKWNGAPPKCLCKPPWLAPILSSTSLLATVSIFVIVSP